MTTIAVELPLVDERSCRNCPLLYQAYLTPYCNGFPSRQGPRLIRKKVKLDDRYWPRRLDQCVAAEVSE